MDLFIGLCVLSRAAALAKPATAESGEAIAIAKIFAQQAKRRMANNIRRIERNEDEQMDQLAGFIVEKGSYPWDVIL
jgi:acyl-CoA dehydrogenase family protein 9